MPINECRNSRFGGFQITTNDDSYVEMLRDIIDHLENELGDPVLHAITFSISPDEELEATVLYEE